VKLNVPDNFSFASTVNSHGWYLLAPFRWSPRDRVLRRAEVIGGKAVDLTIKMDDRHSCLSVQAGVPVPHAELRAKMTRMFQLGVDTSEFVSLARASPAHEWVERSGFGRLLCGATLFEDVVKIIATTNTMWRQTVRMTELLVEKCGKRTRSNRAAFPEPEDVLRFRPDELQTDCRLGYRAKSIHALASGIAGGSIDLARITDPSQTTEELFASYRTLPGIGPYGAAHLLAMDGRHDFIAVDTEFRRFVRERYHKGNAVKDATMLRRYARWGRWKYLAYWAELWASVADRLQPASSEDK
jgi:3-methyladenine DNA glycosylase/8-oxoguanine DNA glycosylase